MGVTIDSAYHKLSKKLISVKELKKIKEKEPEKFFTEFRDYLFCPNYNTGCKTPLVFAIRKGTPYLRTYPKKNHNDNPEICPFEKKETHGRKKAKKNRTEIKEGKIPTYLGIYQGNMGLKLDLKSVENSFLNIVKNLEGVKNNKKNLTYDLPQKKGIKKTKRYIDVSVGVQKKENVETIKTIRGLRQLHAGAIDDIHQDAIRAVYGSITEVNELNDGRLSILLEKNFRVIFSKRELKKMKIKITKNDVGRKIILPVVVYKSKKSVVKKLGNKFYGRTLKGLEYLICYYGD